MYDKYIFVDSILKSNSFLYILFKLKELVERKHVYLCSMHVYTEHTMYGYTQICGHTVARGRSSRCTLVARNALVCKIISSEWFIIVLVPFRVGTVDLYLGSEDRTISFYPLSVHLCNSRLSCHCAMCVYLRYTSHVGRFILYFR